MLLATAAGWSFHLLAAPEATVVMSYLLGVIAVAGLSGRAPAVVASVAAVLLYNFFFTEPRYTVGIHDARHLYTFAMMLVVAIAVSELTAAIRARLDLARERERRFEAMYRVSRRLTGVAGQEQLARAAGELLGELLPGEVALFVPGERGLAAVLEPAAPSADELETARWVFEQGRPAGRGVDAGRLAGPLFVPLEVPGGRVGVLAWRPRDPHAQLGPEGRRLLTTFASQIAQALERDRLADEAHRVQAEARTEKMRSGLLSGLSHDLRTPLAAIAGSASALLQREEPDAVTRRTLAQTVHAEAERLARLVEKVLQMTRIHSGRLEVHKEWQPLDEVIGSALHRLDASLGARAVALAVPQDAPLAPIDGMLIEQVLVNLLENALAYAPDGSPIEVGARAADGDVEVWVADRGPGVADEDRERVFELFVRGPVDGRAATRGVGLGLAICRAVVQAHGGAICVEPRDGGGARFAFTLPLGDAPPPLGHLASAAHDSLLAGGGGA